jgi:hypothetical protein
MGKKVVKGKNVSVKRVIYKKLWKKKVDRYYQKKKHAIEKRKKVKTIKKKRVFLL